MALALNNMRPPPIENMANSQHALDTMYFEILFNYDINAPTEANAWDSKAHFIFIFRHMEFLEIDVKNIFTSLLHMVAFIRTRKVQKGKILDMAELQGFGKVVWNFILFIYEADWDFIPINDQNISFRNAVINNLTLKALKSTIGMSSSKSKGKVVESVKLLSPIPVYSPKEILEKSKFFGKNKKSMKTVNTNVRKLYAQVTSSNVSDYQSLR